MKRLKKNGFSLVELMITVAIMAIVMGIAAPNFIDYMADRRLSGAARMVMSDLMAARQKAVSQNNRFRVFFATNGHHYMIVDDQNNNNGVDTGEATEVRDIQQEYRDVSFTAGAAAPIFYPRGTAWGTTVKLTSSRTGRVKYVIAASTGRVKISDTAPSS